MFYEYAYMLANSRWMPLWKLEAASKTFVSTNLLYILKTTVLLSIQVFSHYFQNLNIVSTPAPSSLSLYRYLCTTRAKAISSL